MTSLSLGGVVTKLCACWAGAANLSGSFLATTPSSFSASDDDAEVVAPLAAGVSSLTPRIILGLISVLRPSFEHSRQGLRNRERLSLRATTKSYRECP